MISNHANNYARSCYHIDVVAVSRMRRGWNLGHKPTDFTKWQSASEPYQVRFRHSDVTMTSRERIGIWNHLRLDCLLKNCSRFKIRKHQSSILLAHLWIKSAGGLPSQTASDAGSVSMSCAIMYSEWAPTWILELPTCASTHCGWGKTARILQRHFLTHFLKLKLLNSKKTVNGIYPSWSNWW